ncbi:methylase involved in ubiquinone/menaquinone biosynthesis [Rubidibacter lacunae KORDI 51-2]|uniref:Methylase involved in ubiquinone/menaquinone biosynthesis n=1 Tax=Rubidibacter lacunae KORDI 51-2 TaxID=582515 RepID=U5DBW9_9CHRO|nr:class I SAM-dependent methyltransferase [Rubidibacter lacunae]ERN42023.1 methylase involved in ubiquinone/menaquinone biosynthesis [Rubidibacter lacunae KORDI 51-2]
MATILRTWSYRYPLLYDAIARLSALAVGGEARFRQLPLQGLDITPSTPVLDLCCGAGQTSRFLARRSRQVVGLDISPVAIAAARACVPEVEFVRGRAEALPFAAEHFTIVHTSAALHEMAPRQREQILREAYRVLQPGGRLTFIDFHRPRNWLMKPGLWLFLWLFETETSWQFIAADLMRELIELGFVSPQRTLHAGGSLQVVLAQKPLTASRSAADATTREENLK